MKIKFLNTLICMLFASVGFAETMQSLPKDKVVEIVKGNTLTTFPVVTLDKEQLSNTWTGYFAEDGKIDATFATKPATSPQSDNGTWSVDDNGLLCITWQKWVSGANNKACIYLYEVQNGYVLVNLDGSFESVFKKSSMKGNQVVISK